MTIEQLAKQIYTDYCVGVGGVAYNGDKLPDADTFFADETKKKQADAWKAVAENLYPKLTSEIYLQRSHYLSGVPVMDRMTINLGNGMELRITYDQWGKLVEEVGAKVKEDLVLTGKALQKFEVRRIQVKDCINDLTKLFYHGDEDGDFMFRTDIKDIKEEQLYEVLEKHRKVLGFE